MIYYVTVVEFPFQGKPPVIPVEACGPTDAILKAAEQFNYRMPHGRITSTPRAAGYEGNQAFITTKPHPLVFYRLVQDATLCAPKELDPNWWPYGWTPTPPKRKESGRYRTLAEMEATYEDY